MEEITLTDSNFPHQEYLTPFLKSKKIKWMRDGKRRKINFFTDNFIKKSIIEIPQDGNKNICLLLEPYTNPPWTDIYDYIRNDFEKFDLIITHNKENLGDLIETRPDKFYYSTKCLTTTWLEEEMIGQHEKTKKLSLCFSYKNFSEGHRLRHLIYEKYKDTGVIDFFGDGVPNYEGEFRDGFVDYKYTIVIENTLQDGFNSEKLNDAFLTGTIPIYWSSKIYDSNYDQNSIFHFSPNIRKVNFNFNESLKNLEDIISKLDDIIKYENLKDQISQNFHYTLSRLQTEDNIFEILKEKNII